MTDTFIGEEGASNRTVEGNLIVRASGALLSGVTVNGDLVIADGADGVMLSNVTVTGRIVIRGGAGGVTASGTTAAKGTIVSNPSDTVLIHAVDGKLGAVTAYTDLTVDGKLDSVTAASKVAVSVQKNAAVGTIYANAAGVKVSGEGKVTEVKANANDISVTNKGAKVTAASGVSGVKAGDKVVSAGKTETSERLRPAPLAAVADRPPVAVLPLEQFSAQTEYTITFDANGGENAPAALKTTKGVLSALPTAQPTRAGYLFAGWTTEKNNTGTKVTTDTKFTANTTVYALWTEMKQAATPVIAFTDGEGASKTGSAFLTTDRFALSCATETPSFITPRTHRADRRKRGLCLSGDADHRNDPHPRHCGQGGAQKQRGSGFRQNYCDGAGERVRNFLLRR